MPGLTATSPIGSSRNGHEHEPGAGRGRPDEYARSAIAIIENAMLNGDTIRLDAGTRFAPE
jgi:hypothetical protein